MPPAAPAAVLILALAWWRGGDWSGPGAGPAVEPESPFSEEGARYEVRLLEASLESTLAEEEARLAEGLALRETDPRGAAALFHVAARRDALGDWALALAADADARLGDVEGTLAAVAALPADLAMAWGWRPVSGALLEAGRPRAAADSALAGLARARIAPDSAEALWTAARAYLRLGDTVSALPLLRRAAREAPSTRASAEAAAALERRPTLDPADRVALVDHRLGRRDLTGALRIADRLSGPGVPSDDRAAGALAVARDLAARGRFADAERRAAAAVDGSSGERLAELRLVVGRARLRQGRVDGARAALEGVVAAAPRSASGQEALFILGDLDDDDGHRERARRRFGEAAALDPSSDFGAEATMRYGLLALAAGDPSAAAERFHALRDAHAGGWRRQQAAYWAGLAHLRAGEGSAALPLLSEAREDDPLGYYALRAAARSGPVLRNVLEPLEPPPPPDTAEDRMARGALARLKALERLGLPEAAGLERLRMADLLAATPGGLHALAEALDEDGRFLEGVRAARDARRRLGRWDTRLLRTVFPLPYADVIDAAARERSLDPALVAALIRQESLFQPGAGSGAGAVGLMQLLPSTARDLARRSGVPAPSATGLKDPALNVRLGTLHLQDLLRARRGRVDEVLAIYNAGTTPASRWRSLVDPDDPDAFVERIPYRETREYVRVVQENAAVYRALYWPDSVLVLSP